MQKEAGNESGTGRGPYLRLKRPCPKERTDAKAPDR